MKITSETNNISARDIAYFRRRQQNTVFHLIVEHFINFAKKNNLSKKDLAKKVNRDPAQITRWFKGPSNCTLDTISDLLLAMDAEMNYEIVPLDDGHKKAEVKIFTDKNASVRSETGSKGNFIIQSQNYA